MLNALIKKLVEANYLDIINVREFKNKYIETISNPNYIIDSRMVRSREIK